MTSVFPLKSETADTTHINFDTFLIMKFYTSTGRRTLRTSILIIYDVQYIGIRKKEYTTTPIYNLLACGVGMHEREGKYISLSTMR